MSCVTSIIFFSEQTVYSHKARVLFKAGEKDTGIIVDATCFNSIKVEMKVKVIFCF